MTLANEHSYFPTPFFLLLAPARQQPFHPVSPPSSPAVPGAQPISIGPLVAERRPLGSAFASNTLATLDTPFPMGRIRHSRRQPPFAAVESVIRLFHAFFALRQECWMEVLRKVASAELGDANGSERAVELLLRKLVDNSYPRLIRSVLDKDLENLGSV